MSRLVYIVIACCVDGDNYYLIDSVWTSERKAMKRKEELNKEGLEWLLETKSCGLFDIKVEFIRH